MGRDDRWESTPERRVLVPRACRARRRVVRIGTSRTRREAVVVGSSPSPRLPARPRGRGRQKIIEAHLLARRRREIDPDGPGVARLYSRNAGEALQRFRDLGFRHDIGIEDEVEDAPVERDHFQSRQPRSCRPALVPRRRQADAIQARGHGHVPVPPRPPSPQRGNRRIGKRAVGRPPAHPGQPAAPGFRVPWPALRVEPRAIGPVLMGL